MPHAVFNLGNLAATADVPGSARSFIPGVEPGGSRAGQPTKPAMRILDARLVFNGHIGLGTGAAESLQYSLKLSQELDLSPGLLLPVGTAVVTGDGTHNTGTEVLQQFSAQGTVWAPRVVGIRVVESGAIDVDCDVHLDYERVDVPWMDWFIMWDFLDNISDNETEY